MAVRPGGHLGKSTITLELMTGSSPNLRFSQIFGPIGLEIWPPGGHLGKATKCSYCVPPNLGNRSHRYQSLESCDLAVEFVLWFKVNSVMQYDKHFSFETTLIMLCGIS
jgi:hypothetical protein